MRRLLKLVAVVLSTLALVYLIWVCIKYREAVIELQLAHAELSDIGLPASIAELEEAYSNSPGSEALSLDYQPLFERLENVSKELAGFVVEESIPAPWNRARDETPIAEIEQFLLQNQDLIELLLETTSRGEVRFPLDFRAGYEIQLKHLAGLRDAQRLLRLVVHVRAAQGDLESVTILLQHMMKLSLSTRGEPLLISKLIYFQNFRIFASAFFDALCWMRFSDDFFLALLSDLPDADGRLQLREGLGSEAVFCKFAFEALARGENDDSLSGESMGSASRMLETSHDEYPYFPGLEWLLLPRAVEAKQMHAECVWRYLQLTSLCELPWVDSRLEWDRCDEELYSQYKVQAPVRNLVGSVISGRSSAERHDTILGLVRMACALERYARRDGKLPEEAFMLVPEFLATLPADSSDNEPIEYLRLDDGFMLSGGALDNLSQRRALSYHSLNYLDYPRTIVGVSRYDLVSP